MNELAETEENSLEKVSPLKPKLKEIKLTGKERAAVLQLNAKMPVRNGADAARTFRIVKFLGSDSWEDWQEWQAKNDIPDALLAANYTFLARKKDIKALSGLIEGALKAGILIGAGVITLNPIYEQVSGESLDPDDGEDD